MPDEPMERLADLIDRLEESIKNDAGMLARTEIETNGALILVALARLAIEARGWVTGPDEHGYQHVNMDFGSWMQRFDALSEEKHG